jgi:N-formylglutamate amidohydrolase
MESEDPAAAAVSVSAPLAQSLPLVLASPHSGRAYEAAFLRSAAAPLPTLRRSEDAWVDDLFAFAPSLGAPLLAALFPRSFVDPNRALNELDPAMFDGALPVFANLRSPRVAAGLGVIPRLAADGEAIYRQRLPTAEIQRRLAACWTPYHNALRGLIEETRERFGFALLIDCHSMPSANPAADWLRGRGAGPVDVVLGDNHGSACSTALTEFVEQHLRGRGFRVARNQPYAGGFTTQHYGRPSDRVHALQIEISRGLYMDERTLEPRPEPMARLKQQLLILVETLGWWSLGNRAFLPRQAAE